ncbi:MAG: hypothetical protein K0R03_362 [Moraxellaceae bacterium]|jgi:hypothetical protein|nr:hypothetical protein [Moraxellaceae bacterium]MDF3029804.1 hypothetical protein [Moraxellaceae bacterium]
MDRKSRATQLLLLILLQAGPAVAVQEMDDAELEQVNGQALFVSDRIGPNSLTGAGGVGSSTDFTYYRLGLDVDMAFNLNIDKLQLGCGGSNENLVANACDIDMDYVRFMGRNGNAPGAAVTSDFMVRRPYIELAVKEDGNKTNREIVGIKIGFESADGALSIGREYANGQVNVERGGTCDTGANTGAGALACESGINYMSGYLNVELSGKLAAQTSLGTANACFGDTTGMGSGGAALHANCDGNPGNNTGADASFRDPFFVRRSGTRMDKLLVVSKQSHHPDDFPAMIYSGLLSPDDSVHVDLKEALRFVHTIILDSTKTKDFFLSFQREQIAYPKFDKSGYAATANTGWWMNIPYAAVRNLNTTNDYGVLGSVALLGEMQEGVNVDNLDMNQSPVSNCYGSSKFC